MAEAQRWQLTGDWFDLCRCRVPCGCTFAQAPDEDQCDGILAWRIRDGNYGDVSLDGLNVVMVGSFMGNLWTGESHDSFAGFFIDERADDSQRQALQAIFGGQAGGFGPPASPGSSTRCAESSSRRSRSRSPTTSPTDASRFLERQGAAPRR